MAEYIVTRKADGVEVLHYSAAQAQEVNGFDMVDYDHAEWTPDAPVVAPTSRTMTKLEYLRQFTVDERVAIRAKLYKALGYACRAADEPKYAASCSPAPPPKAVKKAPGNTERTPHHGGSGSTPGYLLVPTTLPDHRPPREKNASINPRL